MNDVQDFIYTESITRIKTSRQSTPLFNG